MGSVVLVNMTPVSFEVLENVVFSERRGVVEWFSWQCFILGVSVLPWFPECDDITAGCPGGEVPSRCGVTKL